MQTSRLRSFTAVALAVILVVSVAAFAAPPAQQQMVSVLIGFNQGVDPDLVVRCGGDVRHLFRHMPVVAARLPLMALGVLRDNPAIRYVEPDAEVHLLAQSLPWGVDRIDADLVHSETGIKGSGVKVSITDTGIDSDHPDLVVHGGASFISGTTWEDDHGHGTHVAGTVAALDNTTDVIGVAPEAQLYAVKVLDSGGSGSYSYVAQGIEWAIDNGIDVINMSLGGSSPSTTLEDACRNAWNAGIVIVCAAGNSGNSAGTGDNIGYPAKYDTCIAVGATDTNDVRTSFSSTGPALEIMAPGASIPSTRMGGGTTSMSGTSMASPHVAGTAALILSAQPSWTNQEVRDRLNATTEAIGDGDPWKYGNGLVDAYAAVVTDPSQLLVAVSTDKSTYDFGETIHVTVSVTDGNMAPASGADVGLEINTPANNTYNQTGVTNAEGKAFFDFLPQEADGAGSYTFTADAAKTGYTPGSGSTTAEVTSVGTRLVVDYVRTDKPVYGYYRLVWIDTRVVDEHDQPVQGANARFEIETPSGEVRTSNVQTNSSGEATTWHITWPSYGAGTNYVTVTATKVDYAPGTGFTTFLVQ